MSTMPPSINIVKAQEGTWTTLAPMPTPRRELGVAVVDDKIYSIGGYDGTNYLSVNEEFDPTTNTWSRKAPMPTPRKDFAIFVYDNKIHIVGGDYAGDTYITDAYEVYDPQTDTWQTKKRPHYRVSGFDVNVIDDKAYYISGSGHFAPPWRNADSNFEYDLILESRIEKTPIPTAVFRYASGVVNDEIFVIGGYDISILTGYGLTQIYNPKNDSWRLGSPIPFGVSGAGCITTNGANDSRIYVMGGGDFDTLYGNYGSGTNLNQIYNPINDQWITGAPMTKSRILFGLTEVDGELYAIGGYDGDNNLGLNQKYTLNGYEPPEPSVVEFPVLIVASIIIIVLGSIGVLTIGIRTKRRS